MAKDVGYLIDVVCRLPEGRELMDAIDRHCGYGKTVFNPDRPAQNSFNQGMQSVANWLNEKHEQHIKSYKTNHENNTNNE